jgi:flagellar secretion chaperone FliS
MFSPYATQGSAPSQRAHQRAQSAYANTAAEGRTAQASPHGLVSMLFDACFENLSIARQAIEDGDVQRKGVAIGRAVRIVEEGLRGNLNMAAGGALASNLNALYGYLTSRLTHANLHNDLQKLRECEELLRPLRDGWRAIGNTAAPTGGAQ